MSDHKNLYNLREWRRKSKQYRLNNPLCVHCERDGKVKASEVVDHIIDHKGDLESFWNIDNWQALCKKCHSKKTSQENPEYIELKYAKTTIVCGSVGSGVDEYIKSLIKPNDVFIDYDSIYQAISGCDKYIKPKALYPYVNKIRDFIIKIFSQKTKVNNIYIAMYTGEIAKIQAMQSTFKDSEVIILKKSKESAYRNCRNCRKMLNTSINWNILIEKWHEDFEKYQLPQDWVVRG